MSSRPGGGLEEGPLHLTFMEKGALSYVHGVVHGEPYAMYHRKALLCKVDVAAVKTSDLVKVTG